MKITRYFQSCLLIEESSGRILLDASAEETGRYDDFGKLDAVFYTHEHADHFDAELADKFMSAKVPVYANASTAKQMKNQPIIVNDGQEFEVAGFKIKALELPHCLMVDGSAGPQNTGYLFNDCFFDPGDGKNLAALAVENLAVPIQGPDISFKDAFDFAKQIGAKRLLPIHYDTMGAKPDMLKKFCEWFNLPYEITILGTGESTEI